MNAKMRFAFGEKIAIARCRLELFQNRSVKVPTKHRTPNRKKLETIYYNLEAWNHG